MNSCRKYCLSTDTTLYAHWVEARNKIGLLTEMEVRAVVQTYIDASTFENVILPGVWIFTRGIYFPRVEYLCLTG